MNFRCRTLFAFAVAVGLACAVLPPAAKADYVYTYTGNDYTSAEAPYSDSDFISLTLTFSAPLADNLDEVDEAGIPVSWSITDGVYTLTNGEPEFSDFFISTNASGNIIAWDMDFKSQYGGYAFYSGYGPDSDPNGIAPTEDKSVAPGGNVAYNTSDQGLWTETNTAAPEPSTTALESLGGAVVLFAMRRKRTVRS